MLKSCVHDALSRDAKPSVGMFLARSVRFHLRAFEYVCPCSEQDSSGVCAFLAVTQFYAVGGMRIFYASAAAGETPFCNAMQCTSRQLFPGPPLHSPLLTTTASSFLNNARSLHLPLQFLAYPALRPCGH